MSLKLMYITNNEYIAKIAEESGVDWIFIDLEIIGKEERQKNMNSVISRHTVDDVKKIKNSLSKSKVLVRVNSINGKSKEEIDKVIEYGADIVMLPYFKTLEEVKSFIGYVNGRAKVCLLLETPEAVAILDEILELGGIDYIHVGLNDLHIGYKLKFMFELLSNGKVEMICNKIKKDNVEYGFGGIAQLGQGMLPAEYVISEHYRLGSNMAILSRSFCDVTKTNDLEQIKKLFNEGMKKIRDFENQLLNQDGSYFKNNKEYIDKRVSEITAYL